MATDAAAIQELAWVPDETESSFPGNMDDFAERVVGRVRASEAQSAKRSRPYEVRLTPEDLGGEEIEILVRVMASRKKRAARSGRSAHKTGQPPPALPPSTAN
jgi:hypothetical protein